MPLWPKYQYQDKKSMLKKRDNKGNKLVKNPGKTMSFKF